jgi:DNA-binding transcriptional LysR family regulator
MPVGSIKSVLTCSLLKTYVRVVETGNISAAARSLFLAQPAVSAQISAITRAAGITLLERVRGRWEPTGAGQLFYERAKTLLALIDRLEEELKDQAKGLQGHVTLASTRTITDTILPNIIAHFAARYPDIRLEMLTGNRRQVELAIASDEADVALVALPFGGKGLDAIVFAHDRLDLLVPRTHRLAGRESVPFDEIAEESFVLFEDGSGTRGQLEERLGRRFGDLNVRLSLNSNDALVAAVEAGLGITFLPHISARRWMKLGSVHALTLSDVDLERQLAAVTRAGITHSRAAAVFLEFVRGALPPIVESE